MEVFKILNKVLGAILLTLLFTPLIVLATISRLFNFIDLLYQGKIGKVFFSFAVSPFTALLTAVIGTAILLEQGWKIGLTRLFLTAPARIMHFFKKQLSFGIQEDESINDIFVSSAASSGLNGFVTSGFFGKLTLKLLSLCAPMEVYLSYDAKTVSPHNDVSIYFTEKNLSILKQKYELIAREQSSQISSEINSYLVSKLKEAKLKAEELSHLPSSDDTRTGKLQSAQDELEAIQSAQRCVDYFIKNEKTAPDLSGQFQCTPTTVLNYIWLAIKNECPNEQNNNSLKEKLIWTLFQIQRGFNIVNGGKGLDMPECPSGAIGLLVRVICDEQEKMPNSEYRAADPSPANLTLALKTALDRPFTSSYKLIVRSTRQKYNNDPQAYKNEQKENIAKAWKVSFAPLLTSGVLQEDNLNEIIDKGVDAWEPPLTRI
ncbi:hypothetical protein [Legionella cardiaca]|uniref:Transmembrane protein n=1 Tax=Legionella cardiaca TaxID=1071983 RepID=A0ABY8AVT6_9GAMM|nr:hypothetical protein [Legionella cardiaca]WED44276.1 hypothetical protein PXX05_05685 [Legionella cardiaca]